MIFMHNRGFKVSQGASAQMEIWSGVPPSWSAFSTSARASMRHWTILTWQLKAAVLWWQVFAHRLSYC